MQAFELALFETGLDINEHSALQKWHIDVAMQAVYTLSLSN